MPIIGALIARGAVVLAEYCPPGTNFPSIARRLAQQIPSTPDSKNSYNFENHNFNYLVEGGITYICMTDQDMKLRVPYAFLFDINNRFRATFRETVKTAGNLSMNESFSRVIKDRLEFFSNDRNADKITKIKGEVEDAKAIMVQNIDKVLERGERIEVLVSKTEDLNVQATSFKKKSTTLKKKMWWQNCRLTLVIIIITLALVGGATLWLLYHFGVFDGSSDHHHPDSTSTSSAPSPSPSSSSTSGDSSPLVMYT